MHPRLSTDAAGVRTSMLPGQVYLVPSSTDSAVAAGVEERAARAIKTSVDVVTGRRESRALNPDRSRLSGSVGLVRQPPCCMVRGAGLEPARYFYHEPLKLACLPVPPPSHRG